MDEQSGFVDDKVRFGDLKIDTIIGKNHKGTLLYNMCHEC